MLNCVEHEKSVVTSRPGRTQMYYLLKKLLDGLQICHDLLSIR